MTAELEREGARTGVLGREVAVQARYFAGARAAAGVAEEIVRIARPGTGEITVTKVIEAVLTLHPGKLERVLESCSFLLDGVAVRDRSIAVPDGAELDILPPFAGG